MSQDVTDVGCLQDTELLDEAGDEAVVRLVGDRGAVDVTITETSAVAFVGVAERVFDDSHADAADREDRFNVHPDDFDDQDRLDDRRER